MCELTLYENAWYGKEKKLISYSETPAKMV